ncbi:conserved hypothetical protein [Theileria orientalis strain Shintoku]|uniref:Uncharacterized protein n=1 Tax=Theileria orientalis strain Shintoku TaxID=869250 RepID=J4CCJ8_THEOR|nr:conserved hypothetical protein [Theileria orientalis strain Shintoku]BAM39517.1 conserved hypothetical protein [Theileria orientalis strain Shintoku]|eukprot:XP_009689818.1 conserved hypothetical protein [Theileria orientalis strain Shintoku]
MKLFIYNYVLLIIALNSDCIRISFVNNLKSFNGSVNNYSLSRIQNEPSYEKRALKAVSRTGVCVPEDVGLYGRTMISYECLYSKDGRTQTGDEWEAEMTAETKANFPGKDKKIKKVKRIDPTLHLPDEGFKRFELPAPFDYTKMLLREGTPYLRISIWAPGIKRDQFRVFLNYTKDKKYPDSYMEAAEEIPNSPELNTYYETCESEPVEPQHKLSYHSTYNDLFNRMPKPDYGYADVTDDNILRPPLIMINFPKNTIVNQWERVTFASKRDPAKNKKLLRIQRSYRPFSHVDLRNVSCVYRDGTLQMLFKLTHITPPPEFQNNYRLAVSEEGEIKPPKVLPRETVHGWMYNWHMFPNSYDLSQDLSKAEVPEFTEDMKPNFVNDMTPRQVRKFIRDVDEAKKKDK